MQTQKEQTIVYPISFSKHACIASNAEFYASGSLGQIWYPYNCKLTGFQVYSHPQLSLTWITIGI